MEVLNIGVFLYKGKTYPWRILDNGRLEMFYEELSEWRDIFTFVE